MKKRLKLLMLLGLSIVVLTACSGGSKESEEEAAEETEEEEDDGAIVIGGSSGKKEEPQEEVPQESSVEAAEEEIVEEEVSDEAPAGMYASEITGEWIDESLKDQRPMAVMVDDEKVALPHYGLTGADVVYEMVNSTANQGVTRFMAIVKDWGSIKQLGSIRSTRPTNLQIFPEWNAVLCHDGGPYYNDIFYKLPYVERFSGTFSRVNNGKPREFTEYVVTGDLEKNFKNSGYSKTYNKNYEGVPHYQFASRNKPNDLSQYSSSVTCERLELPFHHNNPYLEYDSANKVYKYFQYGQAETDAGNGNKQVSFTNLLLQNARLEQLDEHGYMMYYPTESNRDGWFITNGKAVKVKWTKKGDTFATRYYDESGDEIKLNVGKTYVALIPSDEWGSIVIK